MMLVEYTRWWNITEYGRAYTGTIERKQLVCDVDTTLSVCRLFKDINVKCVRYRGILVLPTSLPPLVVIMSSLSGIRPQLRGVSSCLILTLSSL